MPKGKHPVRALTPMAVRALAKPGRYADGNGLYLVVDETGAKRWLLRTTVRGKRCDIGLGGISVVPLADARMEAQRMRAAARAGEDPLAERRRQRITVPTFREAALVVHGAYAGTWRNAKHAAQWMSTLEQHVFPDIGHLPVNRVTTADVLRVLTPIWLTKAETAKRVRQRIGTIMDWARAAGFAVGENPVRGVGRGLPKQRIQRSHHAALHFDHVPEFISRLQVSDTGLVVQLALEFLVLTAARTGEVVEARWTEIDLEARAWTVPAERMKARREHRVPLSDRAVEILRTVRTIFHDSEFVFPGRSADKPLSNMAFLMAMRRMGESATAHGFRSTFRDWAAEKTNFPRDVCEMALAHVIRDKTEAAYRRGDLLAKRRLLMEAWGRHACPRASNLIELRAIR